MASCKVKPYELIERQDSKGKKIKEEIMLKDNFKDRTRKSLRMPRLKVQSMII